MKHKLESRLLRVISIISYVGVDKVMSLLFNVQSTFVIAFLPRGKYLLIS